MELPESFAPVDQSQIEQATVILKRGGLVAMPTETVYGLACDASNPDALARLYAVKGRPSEHPVIVHLHNVEQLPDWAIDIPEAAYELADIFWPGPMTLILKKHPHVLDAVTGQQQTIGIRIPDQPAALALLEAFGGGLAAPSANRFGKVSPTQPRHVHDDLGDDVDLVIDGGVCLIGIESTILDLSRDDETIRILRPGMLLLKDIEEVVCDLGVEVIDDTAMSNGDVRVPGHLASHYAPRTPVRLLSGEALKQALVDASAEFSSLNQLIDDKRQSLAVLAFQKPPVQFKNPQTHWLMATSDPVDYARHLYAVLRQLDALNAREIWIEAPPKLMEHPAWVAVWDRLRRASKSIAPTLQ